VAVVQEKALKVLVVLAAAEQIQREQLTQAAVVL
jgi:hypothetical protein